MKYSKEEILNALRIIRDICDENGGANCDITCPFSGDEDICKISEWSPNGWVINEPEKKWRALL